MAKKVKEEPFDWGRLLLQCMVAARGLASDDPRIQKACGDVLDETSSTPRRPKHWTQAPGRGSLVVWLSPRK